MLSKEDKKMIDDFQKPENKDAYKCFLAMCGIDYQEENGKIKVIRSNR